METYTAATYGERCADVYDNWHGAYDEAAIKMLVELACGGPALELGIGTGRIALPLMACGIKVHGIDTSPAMVARLRAKPGGDHIPVTVGSFADIGVVGKFSLIFVVFNTLFLLLSQEEQVRCFYSVARHLATDGVFLIEAFVPDVTRYSGGQANKVTAVTTDQITLDMSRHDPVQQRVTGQKIVITDGGIRLYPIQIRYAWPSELDLMAQLAGLRLRHRWGGWQREPFTSESVKHVSIYERAA
ncbi:MAG: class I SAM-dependent methyltransferase [Pyrinomonadaceae bacterium]|nr:class I SAM-dependent methyltransferase [Pyrinomonadaceae bacterium]